MEMIINKTKNREDLDTYGFSYTYVSLFNDIRYTTTVGVGQVSLKMVCGYNNRTKSRWISLETSEGDVVLKRTPIKYRRRCELDSNARILNLDYYIALSPKDPQKDFPDSYDYKDWANDFTLVFAGKPFTKTLELDRNYVNVMVGGNNGR